VQPQSLGERAGAVVAFLRRLRHRADQLVLQPLRNILAGHPRRRLDQHPLAERQRVQRPGRVGERRPPDQQVPHGRGETVQIGEPGLRVAQHRLGRRVLRRQLVQRAGRHPAIVGGAGDAEVGERRPEPRPQDVRRLHVAVDDPDLVRRVQRLADLHPDLEHLGERQRTAALEDLRVRPALAVLHDDVRAAVVGHAGVDDADDVRLAGERDGGLQLAGNVRRRGHDVVDQQDLDGHGPVQPDLGRAEHHSGAAVGDELEIGVTVQTWDQGLPGVPGR